MINVLIGFAVASALAVWLLGWFAVPVILLFCLFACFSPRKKSGAVATLIKFLFSLGAVPCILAALVFIMGGSYAAVRIIANK